MTRVGVLGPPARADDIGALPGELSVEWGVDTVAEALSKVAQQRLDLLVTEASIAFLSEEVVLLVPNSVGRIIAVADTDLVFDWANTLPGVTAVRSFSEIRTVLGYGSPRASLSEGESLTESPGKVIAVWGPVGAPGVTTTAIALATVSAQAGLRTMLCDVDTRGSAVAIALGLMDETPGFAAACRLAGREELTARDIDRVASQVNRDGVSFSVLTGLPRASRWAEVAPAKARTVLALLRENFDAVIVDVGFGIEENEWIDGAPQRDGTSREIVRHADSVVAVGSTDAVGVSRIIRGLDDIRDLCSSPVVVLNRGDRGTGHEASDAIHRFTDHLVRVIVPRDSRSGLHDALSRTRSHPEPWRDIAGHAGLALASPRRAWWRR